MREFERERERERERRDERERGEITTYIVNRIEFDTILQESFCTLIGSCITCRV